MFVHKLRPFLLFVEGDQGGSAGIGSGSGGDQTGGTETTFTQAQVNSFLAEDRRKNASKYADYDDLKAKAEELEQLRESQRTEQEKAIADAARKAADEAEARVRAQLEPQLHAATVRGHAAAFLDDTPGDGGGPSQLDAFMATTNPLAFVGDDGAIDKTKVIGHLTALFGKTEDTGQVENYRNLNPAFGSGNPPKNDARAAGLAEAQRRGYIDPTTTKE